jgi:hypothetical protein
LLLLLLLLRRRQRRRGNVPSFVHAAVSGVKRAKRPREMAENFMMALSHAREAW